MLSALPALLVLIGFPHFGLKPSRPVSPADSLPPAWRTASRFSLEDRFVLGTLRPLRLRSPGLLLRADPRSLHVRVTPDSGLVSTAPFFGDVPLEPAAARSLSVFSRESARLTFERQWRALSLKDLNVRPGATGVGPTTGLSFKLPSPLPARVQSWLGPGGPALNVAGSENIRLSGTSDWTNRQTGLLGQRRSLFPTLNMQQDLDIRLEGQLSDRIKVNLLQNSANQIPLANRIAINYKGDEDDLVQAFDLGNTNLTLPGTQYVSYSGRNEGLFGVKTTLRYGPLDLTVLASKQEGKSERASYSGGASATAQTLADYDYVRGIYYFLYDPSGPTLDIDETSITLYRDNADYTTNLTTVRGRAWADLSLGATAAHDTTHSVLGQFTQLKAGSDGDYEIVRDVYGPNFKIIRLARQVSGEQRLAATYRARYVDASGAGVGEYRWVGTDGLAGDASGVEAVQMKLLRAPTSKLVADAAKLYFETDTTLAPFNPVRELELRNFYQIGGQGIDPNSFSLRIYQGYSDPPVYNEPGKGVPYVEVMGLDNYDESGGTPVRGHDGAVDGTVVNSTTLARAFVDYRNGVLFLPDPRPFAPRLGETGRAFDRAVSALLLRRDSLVGAADPHSSESVLEENAANPLIYDGYNPLRSQSSSYFIEMEYKASQVQGEISLGRSNILESSEVVTVNGEQWVRDKDYTVDYDLGTVTLKRQVPTGAQLNVNYSYAPLFQQAGRTLVGSAFRLDGRDKGLGGAFLYESKGAQDLRPRLGEEPSRSLITDLNTAWTFRPGWMTRLVDRLPGVRTTAASTMAVQAEVGVSMPNPNTRNEVYVDDMEGTRDAVSLSMAQERWGSASAPLIQVAPGTNWSLAGPEYLAATDTLRNAELRWYSPPGYVKERDLKPNLSDAQGGRNPHQVLCLSVPRRPHSVAGDSTRLWGGVTTLVDQAGLDLSRAQFIELWVNDFNDLHAPGDGLARVRGRHVRLHVDIGSLSEDQMRSPDVTPNGVLDTEDRVRDNVLTEEEDTGLDGLADPDAGVLRDRVRADPVKDLEGDDFYPPDDVVNTEERRSADPRYWTAVNGTEGNRTNRTTPDTEDLNLNGALDVSNDYVEYTIDLGNVAADAPYLVTDVQRDFGPTSPSPVSTVGADNGWRRYRIPLADTLAVEFGNPNLALVQHVRVWVQGAVESDSSAADIRLPLLMVGGLEIVGSRWEQTALDSVALAEPLTTMTLNTVNSVDNADVYVAPFDPGETRNGSEVVMRREQSISLEFTDLKPGSAVEAFKTFSLDEDYSRYGKLDWFAAAYDIRDEGGRAFDAAVDTALCYFVRFASDETGRNYYEYRSQLPGNSTARSIRWSAVALQLTSLSNLKLNPDFPKTAPIRYAVAGAAAGESLIVNGTPSFTRLRRISFGLMNRGERRYASGQLWFDELRATDIAKDADHAQRVQVTGQLADLMSYNLSWSGRGADFLSVGESRGSGTATDQLAWNTSIQTHRFFERTGISLPVNLGYTRNSSRPRFSAGSDIVRTGAMQDASEARSESRSFSTSYSRAWSERSNPFLRYTLGGITASYSLTESKSRNPSAVDSTATKAATVNYQIAPRKLLAIPLPLMKGRLYPLPERAYWNYAVSTTHSVSYERLGAELDSLRLSRDVSGRAAGISFGADSRPLDLVQHHIEGRRNLTLPEGQVRNDKLGFINLGRVVDWRQSMNASYTHARGRWLKPSLSWSSSYNQNNGPELSKDLGVRSVSNGQSVEMNLELPFERLFAKAARPGARTGAGTSSPAGAGVPPRGRVVGAGQPGPGPAPPGVGGPRAPMPGEEELDQLGPDERAALLESRQAAGALPATPPRPAPPDTARLAAAADSPPRPAPPDTTRLAAAADTLRRTASPDSTRGRPLPPVLRKPSWSMPSWRSLIGAFGNVATNAGFSRTSSYTRLTGTPSFAYLFGFSSRLDTMRTHPEYGNSANISTSWHSSAKSRVRLPFGSSANARFELTERVVESNAVRTQSRTVRFPDFDVEYGRVTSVLRLDRFFTSPQLRTAFSRSTVTEYANSRRSPTGRSVTSNWRPLIGLSGSLKSGTRAELKVERRVSETENLLSGHSVTTDRLTTSNFSLSRSYSKGQKVSVLGKAKTMSTTVSLGLTGQYEHHKGETISYADATRSHPFSTKYPAEDDRLSLNGTGSYSFSTNVTGNLTLGYGQSNNRVTKIKSRNIRVELRAQFTF